MTVNDVFLFLDSIAPFDTQLPFDNAGLLIGSGGDEVTKIGVCLDITPDNVRYAAENGINLIVSHHPVIFHPLKRLAPGEAAYDLAAGRIAAICAHTNLDAAVGGVNDALCDCLGLENVKDLNDPEYLGFPAIARIGKLPSCRFGDGASAKTLADYAVECTGAYGARFVDAGRKIKTVAVCSGAGGGLIKSALCNGTDALISGDIGYHEFLLALEKGLSVIDVGHFASENVIVGALSKRLEGEFPECEVCIIPADDPIRYSFRR